MKLKLPPVVLSMIKRSGAKVDKKLRATRAQLVKTCKEHGYPPHASVIAFEAAFGGLTNPDDWLFGTYACLTSGAHSGKNKNRKLVPVVYSDNDVIYYLDEKGRGYAEDTIEDTSASYYAEDKTSLVCRIVLNNVLFSRGETSFDLPGLQGDALSKRLSLKLIKEASGKDRRFFADSKGDILVAEDIKAKQTRFAGATKKQLKLVEKPVAPVATKTLVDLDLNFKALKELPAGIDMKSLRSLTLRRSLLTTLPEELADATNLTKLILTECDKLDVDAALLVIARLPKIKDLSLPLSNSLTSLAPLATLPLKSLYLSGTYVKHPHRLPSGLGQLKKLTDLCIDYADDIAELPDAPEDVRPLRLLFSKRFTDEDIRKSIASQPEVLYLQAFVKTL